MPDPGASHAKVLLPVGGLDSILKNNGKVLIKGLKGNLIVLKLLPESDEQAADFAKGKVFFDCRNKAGQEIPGCIPEQGLNLPAKSITRFSIEDTTRSLEPNEDHTYWRYVHLDVGAKAVEVQTFIEVPDSRGKRGWTIDKVYTLHPE